ncbi:MAG: hypothetical protein WC236_09330 [Gallionellaceae bacterium]|jgi:hypothetical protein
MPKIIVTWLVCIALSGCTAGNNYSKIYPNTLDKNLSIYLNLGNVDKLPSKIDVYVGVNDISKDCTDQFQGDISISPGVNKIGLAPGKKVYVVVAAIDRGDFLGRNAGYTVRHGALLTPRVGRQYEIVINYIDEMWDYKLYEINGSRRVSLPVVSVSPCNLS